MTPLPLRLSLLAATARALQPFATPQSWKVHNLGGPRVVKDDAGYTLYYHYRPLEDAANPELPPLSTGRVARATSADGLAFKQETDGIGEAGSTLSKNDEWYWFDSGHVGCGAALCGGDTWFLYTYGGSNAPLPLRDLGIDRDGEAWGMDLKIGVAVSQDGVNFGRVEADCADGSALDRDASSWERPGAPVAWPAVCAAPDGSGDLLMFYGATAAADGASCVGVARSTNGVRWNRVRTDAPCLAPGPPGSWDAGGIMRRAVVPWEDELLMIYEAKDGANVHALGRATSTDGGATWARSGDGPVFSPGGAGAWDAGAVSSPDLVALGDGGLRLYYAASAAPGGPMALGCAESRDGGLSWERLD